MTLEILPEELSEFIKAYNGQVVGLNINGDFLNIDASVSILGVKMGLELSANDTININVAKGTVAGLNFTSLVRNKFFNLLKGFNSDKLNFTMVNNIISVKVSDINFTNITLTDQIVLEFKI